MFINTVRVTRTGNVIKPEGITMEGLYEKVMAEKVVILKNLFPKKQLVDIRSTVHQWGLKTAPRKPQTYIKKNYHGIESGVSPRQKTPHNYHAYNFNSITALETGIREKLMSVVEPLRIFQNRLTGNNAQYQEDEEGRQLHPQIIHYPSGGGMFGQHVHGLEPQRIGLILGLSERGRDFERGATYFEVDGKRISSERYHDIGDMILFKFDIPHGISEIDAKEKIDYKSERGRWTLVLPYYSLKKLYKEERAA